MLYMPKTYYKRKAKVQKVRKAPARTRAGTDNLRQDLKKRIDECYRKESHWYNKGNEARAEYKRIFKKEA